MHELSIAQAVAETTARHAAGRRVVKVELKVGHLRQVVPDALAFSWELLVQGTELDGAELAIEEIPAAVACTRCGGEGDVDGFPLACRACGNLDVRVVRGEELLVDALELDEDEVVTGEMATA